MKKRLIWLALAVSLVVPAAYALAGDEKKGCPVKGGEESCCCCCHHEECEHGSAAGTHECEHAPEA